MGNLCCAGWKEDEDEGFCLSSPTSTVPSAPITEELLVSGQCKKIDVPVVTEGPLENFVDCKSFKSLPIGLGGTFTKPIDIDQIDSVHEKTFTEPIPLVPRETISIPINTQKTSCKGQSNLNSSTKQSDPN
ncbi:hypothetical protein DMENIID0001_028970 [Sergentomyia squamirostris]